MHAVFGRGHVNNLGTDGRIILKRLECEVEAWNKVNENKVH